EIYGMPKELGWISIPVDPGVTRHLNLFVKGPGIDFDPISLDAMTIRQFNPDSRASRLRLLAVQRADREDTDGDLQNDLLKRMRNLDSIESLNSLYKEVVSANLRAVVEETRQARPGRLGEELAKAIQRAVTDKTKLALPGLRQELKSAP